MTTVPGEPTVMLVDDDEVDLMQFTRQLNDHGGFGEILTYDRPEDALAFFRAGKGPTVDVLLLDMRMPTMSGFEFLKQADDEFGTDYVGMTAILTTLSLAEMHLQRATTDPSVRAYFQKPLTTSDLTRILKLVGAVEAARERHRARSLADSPDVVTTTR